MQNGQFPNQPQHTFFQHNVGPQMQQNGANGVANTQITGDWTGGVVGPPTLPANYAPNFDWLVQLDRPLVSPPGSLLQVSGYPPYQLTQMFMTGQYNNQQRFQHRVNVANLTLNGAAGAQTLTNAGNGAGWFDDSLRIYRLFEYVQTAPIAQGATSNGRLAGKININTVWDPEVFQALCDMQAAGYYYTATDVANTWSRLQAMRNVQPFLSVADTAFGAKSTQYPNPPFVWNYYPTAGSAAQTTTGTGTQDTFFATADGSNGPTATGPRLFQKMASATDANGHTYYTDPNPTDNPYFKSLLMSKIFNNVTVRSNVFAVWLTVGYFEVIDDTTRPVKLGAEIGRSENKHVRHRMFSIIDRTALNYYGTTSNTVVFGPGVVNVTPAAMTGTGSNGATWTINVGDQLLVDVGTASAETVTVTATTATTFTATFTSAHAANFVITNNIGARNRFNPHAPPFNGLVLYHSIID